MNDYQHHYIALWTPLLTIIDQYEHDDLPWLTIPYCWFTINQRRSWTVKPLVMPWWSTEGLCIVSRAQAGAPRHGGAYLGVVLPEAVIKAISFSTRPRELFRWRAGSCWWSVRFWSGSFMGPEGELCCDTSYSRSLTMNQLATMKVYHLT